MKDKKTHFEILLKMLKLQLKYLPEKPESSFLCLSSQIAYSNRTLLDGRKILL